MPRPNEKLVQFPQESSRDVLTEVLHRGAQHDVADGDRGRGGRLPRGSGGDRGRGRAPARRSHGHLPTRAIQTPLGDVRCSSPGSGTVGP